MAFSASSFAPEFWFAEGEPYNRCTLALNAKGKPVSFWSAATMALQDPDTLAKIADDVETALGHSIEPQHITAELLMDLATACDTVDQLHSPIGVYICDGSFFTIDVYDGPEVDNES